MGKLKFVLLGLILTGIIGYACKKEPVDSKLFVERYLVGQWPIKTYVRLEYKNGIIDSSKIDTILPIQNDTSKVRVKYTEGMTFIKNGDTIKYSIDADGKNINFATTPDSTWTISYLRNNYFKITHTRQETIGTDVHKYVIEQEFSKL
ncbi:hypothetical protein [Pedobacter xixiisoli]|uniref:Lipocalin-like domain-containing protein n=1 Tax=Pedobacter xixiisoli TaxID=1476464 RepID=A0A286A0N7_9SPHI|nr:hypothetical protein [Pedobacter xixiisoli]SOD15466.1 hypothetical protein SAMN06297358_2460 [Pedobacter xixiisoli]